MKSAAYSFCLSVVCLLGVGSCKRPSAFVNEMEAFAEEVCKCQSMDCANEIQGRYKDWLELHNKARGSQEDLKDTRIAQVKFEDCYKQISAVSQ